MALTPEEEETLMTELVGPPRVAVPPPVEPPKIKVRVTRSGYSVTGPDGNPMQASKARVLLCMPPQFVKMIPARDRDHSYYGINDMLHHATVPLSVWATAISQAVMLQYQERLTPQVEITAYSPDQLGYLSIGETLYQLAPISVVKHTKALQVMRAAAKKKLELYTNEQKRAAELAANTIIEHARELEYKAQEMLQRASQGAPPPQDFMRQGVPLMFGGEYWSVGIFCDIHITSFQYGETVWAANPTARTVPVGMWVTLLDAAGKYDVRGIRIMAGFTQLPHMSYGSACLSLGDAPERLTANNLHVLQEGIERCFKVVNLGSLLRAPQYWKQAFGDVIPTALAGVLQHSDTSRIAGAAAELARKQSAATAQRDPNIQPVFTVGS